VAVVIRAAWSLAFGALLSGCGARTASAPPATEAAAAVPAAADTPARQAPFERRAFAPVVDGKPVIAGISYGPYRAGQKPGGPDPTADQILEDLRIIAPRWHMIRYYSSRGPGEDILRVIRDNDLPIRAMVGVWIAPDAPPENAAEVAEAIRLANAYPDQVLAVSVGNESQVAWSGHRTPPEVLIAAIRTVRAGIQQPVTTADDYNFWNKPESHAVADEVDFLLLHAYAMWNKQPLDDAVPWTARTVAAIAAEHPDLKIVLGETGWATELNDDAGPDSDQKKQILAPAGIAEQTRFHAEFSAWAAEAAVPYFYFEAFDEPWKGGADPRDIEKHWGLFGVDRQPKARSTEAP
jgi:exo-beta-1,3-glucanase (GH17 family)